MRFNLYAKIRPLWMLYGRLHIVRRHKELQFFSQFVKNGDLCFDVEGAEEQVLKGLSRPISIISFEFHKELLPSAKNCVDHLITLGGVKFNCSMGALMRLLFPEWMSGKEFFKKLKSIGGNIQGDIYARF